MAWDWKRNIGKLFGVSAQANTATTLSANPAVAQAVQQLANGTHRSYNRAELNDITAAFRDLKDATRNNLIVLQNLMNAQAKQDEPAVKELLAKMKTDLAASYSASESVMVDLNGVANTLEQLIAKAANHSSAQDSQNHLPVYDVQRNLVIGLTAQLRDVYTVHNGLTKVISNTQPLITLPEPDRVTQALESNNKKLPNLIPKLIRVTMETLGKVNGSKASKGFDCQVT